ncbi:MAG: DUF3459 domain-containing protein [Ruminococcaceae bacterium]|nr:DUF3459 domain-containing protein [Oscillospiraceae bacterium]
MLLKLHDALESGQNIKIEKLADGKDVSLLGAFPCGTVITLRLSVPRALGASAVVLRIHRDGAEPHDLPLSFLTTDHVRDVYTLRLDTEKMCEKADYGLFYYEYLLVRGWDTLFSDTVNNVDCELSPCQKRKFRLLIYEKDFAAPDWFSGGIMYHVFLDRFFKGEGSTALHKDAVIDPDWKTGIPQYARAPGAPLSNNVFFGGNLWGVAQKLDYLSSLGVTVLYLSPLFDAYSNHRYDTADYERIDSILGGEEAFDHLIKEAHARGMRVILDGVFNHTGDDSRYFNRRGNYPEKGAYQSKNSPYYSWYTFRSFPNDYECWWNIEIMPRLDHRTLACRRYFTGANGIVEAWLKRGADGWRLDVADELSDDFLDELRETVKKTTDGEGLIIGEVWENAADKIAYGKRRRYFSGRQLDSVMNYPFRNAVLAFLERGDAKAFYDILTELYSSYPVSVSNSLMNLLGTHDTERILTRLGDSTVGKGKLNAELARLRLSKNDRDNAIQRLKLASAIQFTVFGVPSVYYGDEAGLEGYHDPFCRMPFPWGEENEELLAHYRALGKMRRAHPALKDGTFRFLSCEEGFIAYERKKGTDRLILLANMGEERTFTPSGIFFDAMSGRKRSETLTLPHGAFCILSSKGK